MNRNSQEARNGLPMGWRKVPVGELTVRTKQRDPRRNPTMSFRYVDVSSVSNSSFRIIETTELLGADAPSRARKEICTDDVLFATVRPTLKRIALVPPELNGEIASTGFIVLRAERSQLEPRYLYTRLLTDEFIKRMGELERGASYPAVRDSDVLNEVIPVPPLPEQRKIAGVLGLVQRAMEQQKRLLAVTAEWKKVLLRQLFTHGLRHEPQKQTELGPLPQSWEVVELGSVVDLINGFAFKSKDYVSTGVLNFRVVNIRDEGVIDTSSDTEFLPNEFMQTHKQYLLSEGDILLVMVGATRGKLGFIPKRILPALMNQNMWRIVPKTSNELHRKYLYHFLTIAVPRFVREFSESARGFFKKSDFRCIKLPKPTFTKQQEIADGIDKVEQKLDLHRRKHAALSALFRTLLHELMTARIRVHDLDLPGCE
jgi:type I restriction enzyme S subunit